MLVDEGKVDIQSLSKLYRLESAASSGSRKAYRELHGMAGLDLKYFEMVTDIIDALQGNLREYRVLPFVPRDFVVPMDNAKMKLSELSTEQLLKVLEKRGATRTLRQSITAFLTLKPKSELCKHSVKILGESGSLDTVAVVTAVLEKKLGQRAPFLDADGWVEVCEGVEE